MEEIKISIIMPVYGVEKYVGKAIESIQAQTLTDWEMFAVDDGTKDSSGVICDEYAVKDSRIRVIHKENGGAPSARNIAIPQARGKYIYFMDSDDWAEHTMLQDMYELAEKNNAQYIVTGYFIDTYHSDTEYTTQELFSPHRCLPRSRNSERMHTVFLTQIFSTPHGTSCFLLLISTRTDFCSPIPSGTIFPLISA